jgi:hypothetical protein
MQVNSTKDWIGLELFRQFQLPGKKAQRNQLNKVPDPNHVHHYTFNLHRTADHVPPFVKKTISL